MPSLSAYLRHKRTPARTPVDFDAVTKERARFGEAAIEARRVQFCEVANDLGINFFAVCMVYQPHWWADQYNRATDATEQMDALIALDVWNKYRTGAYFADMFGAVRS